MTAGRGVRAVRAAVFAAVCVLLAALGHVLMSRTAVPWWALAAGAAVTGAAAWCLAERERGCSRSSCPRGRRAGGTAHRVRAGAPVGPAAATALRTR